MALKLDCYVTVWTENRPAPNAVLAMLEQEVSG